MKFLAALVTASLFATSIVASDPLVANNPGTVAVCKPFKLSWSGGTPPYSFSLDEDTSGGLVHLVEFAPQNGTFYSWVFDLSLEFIGDSFVLKVFDSAGQISQSTPFEIQDSSDHSCFVNEPGQSKTISKAKIVGICLGILGFFLLLAVAWRFYMVRTRRRLSAAFRGKKNIGVEQNFPLSPVQQNGTVGGSESA